MLIYHDYSGQLVSRFLGLPSISSSWFLFEKQNIELMVNYIKNCLDKQYIVLNHQSYSPMNVRLMDYQGAFGLSNMPNTRKNKCLSLKFDGTYKIYTDVSNISNVSEKELENYLYKVFYNDYGFIINELDENNNFNKIFHQVVNNNFLEVSKYHIKSISLFINYDDLFRGILTLHISKPLRNKLRKNESNVTLERIEEINSIYGCRIAGSAKSDSNYISHLKLD